MPGGVGVYHYAPQDQELLLQEDIFRENGPGSASSHENGQPGLRAAIPSGWTRLAGAASGSRARFVGRHSLRLRRVFACAIVCAVKSAAVG